MTVPPKPGAILSMSPAQPGYSLALPGADWDRYAVIGWAVQVDPGHASATSWGSNLYPVVLMDGLPTTLLTLTLNDARWGKARVSCDPP